MLTPEPNLNDKVFLITGSTQVIGQSLAKLLAEYKPKGLVICDRNATNGKKVAEELNQYCTTHFIQTDLTKEQDCHQLLEKTDTAFQRIDGLVNAAGLTDRGTLEQTDTALWNKHFNVKARAPFLLMQGAASIMQREKIAGSIVNITSTIIHGGSANLITYAASKSALARASLTLLLMRA